MAKNAGSGTEQKATEVEGRQALPLPSGPRRTDPINRSRARAIVPVSSMDDAADDLASGSWVKKADLVSMGSFNIIGASRRENTFKRKTTQQIVFEIQFLDGDFHGEKALFSTEENPVRLKYYNYIQRKGGVGPLILIQLPAADDDMSGAYVFHDPRQPLPSTDETQDELPL